MQSCLFLLCPHIVETIAQIDHSVKAYFCKAREGDNRDAGFCKANQRPARFEINVDNNNDIQQINDDVRGNCGESIGVGTRKSSFGDSRVEF